MSISLEDGKSVLSMTIVDIDSGKEQVLFEREGRRCLFNDDIYFEGYIITLRIDWSDIRNTDPVLDADIYRNHSGQKGKKLRNGIWHQTEKQFDVKENRKIYEFVFNDLRLRLGAKMSFSVPASMDAILVKAGHDK